MTVQGKHVPVYERDHERLLLDTDEPRRGAPVEPFEMGPPVAGPSKQDMPLCCKRRLVLLFVFAVVSLVIILAVPKPPASLFLANAMSDHMVLSRSGGSVWGYSVHKDDHIDVTLSITGSPFLCKDAVAGTPVSFSIFTTIWLWKCNYGPQDNIGPYALRVESRGLGTAVVLKDVYFGEVFLCSGQSNMEFTVGSEIHADVELEKVKSGKYDRIRFLIVGAEERGSALKKPSMEFRHLLTPWTKPSPSYFDKADCTINDATKWNAGISAVCWDFGRRVYEHLEYKVPVGLVDSAYGGTSMAYWSPPGALETRRALKMPCQVHQGALFDQTGTDAVFRAEPAPVETCSGLYNGMLHPLLHMSFSAIAWYQGENDVPISGDTKYFACAFKALLNSFRDIFGSGNDDMIPILAVQLAPYNNGGHSGDSLANTRATQAAVIETIPRSALITTLDLGDWDSPCGGGNIHPRNKERIGARLFAYARRMLYSGGNWTVLQSPRPTLCTIFSNSIEIVFDKNLSVDSPRLPTQCHAPTGRLGGRCVPSGYEVEATRGGKWHPISTTAAPMDNSSSKIEANGVRVYFPTAGLGNEANLRYAYSDFPALSLFGASGVPVSQFTITCNKS